MGIPLRISEELALRARAEAEATERSLTGQVEHWARIGAAVEAVLGHREALALKKAGLEVPLDEALTHSTSTAGRDEALRAIASKSEVRYEADPDDPKRIIRVADGKRTRGRFVGRRFQED